MGAVLNGFAVIALVVGVGVLLARRGVIDDAGRRTLALLVYYVGAPALLIDVLVRTSITTVVGPGLVVAAGSVVVVLVVHVFVDRIAPWRHRPGAESGSGRAVVAGLVGSYANAGYLGLPIATYVLGDPAWAVPVMVVQLIVYAPVALAVLGAVTGSRRVTLARLLGHGVRNPVSIAAAVGLTLALTGQRPPGPVADAVGLLADLAVPTALIGFGVALGHSGWRPAGAGSELTWLVTLKLVVQPFAAWLIADPVLGLASPTVAAVTLMAALPTAQNVLVYATRYRTGEAVARDGIALSTIVSLPVLAVIAVLGA